MRHTLLRVARRGMAGGPDGRPRPNHKPHVGGPYIIGHTQYATRLRAPLSPHTTHTLSLTFCAPTVQEPGD